MVGRWVAASRFAPIGIPGVDALAGPASLRFGMSKRLLNLRLLGAACVEPSDCDSG